MYKNNVATNELTINKDWIPKLLKEIENIIDEIIINLPASKKEEFNKYDGVIQYDNLNIMYEYEYSYHYNFSEFICITILEGVSSDALHFSLYLEAQIEMLLKDRFNIDIDVLVKTL